MYAVYLVGHRSDVPVTCSRCSQMLTFPVACRIKKILSRALCIGIGTGGGGGGVDIELAPNSLTYGIEFEVCNESQWGAAEIAVDLYASSPWKTDQHKY